MSNIDKHSDEQLAAALKLAQPADASLATFDEIWAAAEARHRSSRRRYAWLATAAATAAFAVVAINAVAPSPPVLDLIAEADLLGTTSWPAPSDALLPDHSFDIYQDLPELTDPLRIRSTNSADGALL